MPLMPRSAPADHPAPIQRMRNPPPRKLSLRLPPLPNRRGSHPNQPRPLTVCICVLHRTLLPSGFQMRHRSTFEKSWVGFTGVLVHGKVSPGCLACRSPTPLSNYAFHPRIKRLRLRKEFEASRLDIVLEMRWDELKTLRRLSSLRSPHQPSLVQFPLYSAVA